MRAHGSNYQKLLFMKKTFYIIAVFLGGLLLMTGCRKDELAGGIMLTTETFTPNGTKIAVSGDQVHWVNGDQVRINGQTATVEVSGSDARATGIENLSGAIRAYYPASIITASGAENEGTDNPTVVIPSEYVSFFSNGNQNISLPMVGKANEGASSIKLYHVTAAIKVRVKNNTEVDNTIYLDSIVVVSATQQLSGPASVSNNGSSTTVSGASDDSQYRRVKVKFNDGVSISYGSIVDVQVPILPIAEVDGNDITFKVYTHKAVSRTGMPTVNYSYNYSRALHSGALGRNILATTQIAVTTEGAANSYTKEVDHSLFTIYRSNSAPYSYSKIRFSQGNLQYRASDNYWRFAEHQYDYLGNGESSGNNTDTTARKTQTKFIDLYFWASSGYAVQPYLRAPMSTTKQPKSNIEETNYDWGVYNKNKISNGGTTDWKTLTTAEWNYLLLTGASRAAIARYVFAKIGSIYGLIVFPDNYIHPDGAAALTNVNVASTWAGCYDATEYWNKMEQAGAVFLPAAGYGNSYAGTGVNPASTLGINEAGWYWSTTYYPSNNQAKVLKIANNIAPNMANVSKSYCSAVRLVTTVE